MSVNKTMLPFTGSLFVFFSCSSYYFRHIESNLNCTHKMCRKWDWQGRTFSYLALIYVLIIKTGKHRNFFPFCSPLFFPWKDGNCPSLVQFQHSVQISSGAKRCSCVFFWNSQCFLGLAWFWIYCKVLITWLPAFSFDCVHVSYGDKLRTILNLCNW